MRYQPFIPRAARWRRNIVGWSCFPKEVESKINNLPDEPNLSLRTSRFNDILISAAATHVGKSKPSKESKPWMNPHVRVKRICILYTYPYTIGSGYTNKKNKFIIVKESL